jgi:heavy metal sensor kinase
MRRSLRPVGEITRQAERITSRNLSERLPSVNSGDEIERLSTSLNHMIARLEGAFHHINRFSADASHELRTPLTIIRGELESLVRQQHSPEETMEIIGSSLEEVERLARIVEDLLAISRLDVGEAGLERVPVDLGDLAASTIEQLHVLADEKTIDLQFESDMGVVVSGDRWRLKQVIVNLVDNAIKYTGNNGRVWVKVTRRSDKAILEISDSGIGIEPEDLRHVFERFYTSNRSRSRDQGGTGLGLPIVKAICTAHQAEISVSSELSKGTVMRIEFPLEPSNVEISTPPKSARTSNSEAGIPV